jgi:hypothetical protein
VEFRRLNLYLLLLAFGLCTIPPIVWNSQHAWITLAHLKSRGSLDQAPGFHPLELGTFLGEHFITYSPLLFLGLVWATIASWRRARQNFKVLYLLWFGLPVFLLYTILSFNKPPPPTGMALPSSASASSPFPIGANDPPRGRPREIGRMPPSFSASS